jgi:hypothetical protein
LAWSFVLDEQIERDAAICRRLLLASLAIGSQSGKEPVL